MKKILYIIFIAPIIIFTSCSYYNHFRCVPNFIKKDFRYKYDKDSVQGTSQLNINGYFSEIAYRKNTSIRNDSSIDFTKNIDKQYLNFILFDDGICVFGLVNTIHGDIVDRYNTAIPQYIEYVVKNDSINIKNYFYEEHEWGRYIICNDTLKMQWIERPMNLNGPPWQSFEIWYKIIDKNTLERIYTRPIFKQQSDIDTYYNYTQLTFKYEPAKFIETKALPSSDGWIKKQKWFWENESDWKEYMKHLKNK